MNRQKDSSSHLKSSSLRHLGAEVASGGVFFRVWATKCRSIDVLITGSQPSLTSLKHEGFGYFSGLVKEARDGDRYWYVLDGGRKYPDPCSSFQPDGPYGPSLVVDHRRYRWNDHRWNGLSMKGQVFYELHVGAFTKEGTYDAARKQLRELKRIGVTVVELMPLNECPGSWNWGYDGTNLFAPYHVYGPPESLKKLIDEAHRLGIGVILDVVYNHLGPEGNCLSIFADRLFSEKYKNEWGESLNFDGEGSYGVRNIFIQNAKHWISNYHFDGLRLDATQSMFDSSPRHILSEISSEARNAASGRRILVVAENEPQDVRYLRSTEKGGLGMDGIWIDDFHHTARVRATGLREAYYKDYLGSVQELISLIKRGSLYQGQYYEWQKKERGSIVTSEPAEHFLFYLQNHDQIANHQAGARLTRLTDLSTYRALTSVLLLAPQTPLIFMGQEFASSKPFEYFSHHPDNLAIKVFKGRKGFLTQFSNIRRPKELEKISDPNRKSTFERCKLDFSERKKNAHLYKFHKDLINLRRTDPVISAQNREKIDGAVLGADSFLLRYTGEYPSDDRILVVNFGPSLNFKPMREPMLAAVPGYVWKPIWFSEESRYGGKGGYRERIETRLRVPARSSVLFVMEKRQSKS